MMPDQRKPVCRITTEDLETGETTVTDLPAGDYAITVTHPCRLDGMQSYRGGRTVILTLKDRDPGDPE